MVAAPPTVALLGLLGMLIGEQVLPPIKRAMAGEPVTSAWFRAECVLTNNLEQLEPHGAAPRYDCSTIRLTTPRQAGRAERPALRR